MSRNARNYQTTLHNIQEERRYNQKLLSTENKQLWIKCIPFQIPGLMKFKIRVLYTRGRYQVFERIWLSFLSIKKNVALKYDLHSKWKINNLDMCFSLHFRIALSDTPTNAQMIFIISELAYMSLPQGPLSGLIWLEYQ
jgi:hypothetical protein